MDNTGSGALFSCNKRRVHVASGCGNDRCNINKFHLLWKEKEVLPCNAYDMCKTCTPTREHEGLGWFPLELLSEPNSSEYVWGSTFLPRGGYPSREPGFLMRGLSPAEIAAARFDCIPWDALKSNDFEDLHFGGRAMPSVACTKNTAPFSRHTKH